ncbi:hypothetical protein FC83_GL001430 [Agrilactobacillus composti DSM 18527 = JCM 14202]|uniref:DNA-entry nuclease n=1 Tax=Agrilactobacillus composti DSM 18527 = JCM 14202 TaxID=1423734 RepID=X0PHV0_9LACO|nr:hypothetical protein [Agrilactobacillus composti]KRM30869.1 hypothetical protein FC83_GL001430 [Agrilactobacillus composti DSM 18527 = JCM 14202]GAF41744.1 hypothetical protein JCM14202_3702 [Agrilactobacillus composti DSM 18527 = JCM 14202]
MKKKSGTAVVWNGLLIIGVFAILVRLGAIVALLVGLAGFGLYLYQYLKLRKTPPAPTLVRPAPGKSAPETSESNQLAPIYKQWWLYCLILAAILFAGALPKNNSTGSKTSTPTSKMVSENKADAKKLAAAKATSKSLAAVAEQQSSESASLAAAATTAQSAAASETAASQSQAAAQAPQNGPTQPDQQAQQTAAAATPNTASQKGNMTTATGQIIGNANSKIYHVPGQAGYRMNSANAVIFNSEQDAQNAGYRKALR